MYICLIQQHLYFFLRDKVHVCPVGDCCSLWLDALLPMVMDREAGVKEKCLTVLEEVLLQGLTSDQAEGREYAWVLLSIITDEERLDMRFVYIVCLHSASQ